MHQQRRSDPLRPRQLHHIGSSREISKRGLNHQCNAQFVPSSSFKVHIDLLLHRRDHVGNVLDFCWIPLRSVRPIDVVNGQLLHLAEPRTVHSMVKVHNIQGLRCLHNLLWIRTEIS